jgi:hypothetical protein
MNKHFKKSLPAGRQGFTIIFATLIAALALAVGAAIYDLTVRELDLSMIATQSQAAIYAADSGAECALYWDAKYTDRLGQTNETAFATSSDSAIYTLTPTKDNDPATVVCNSQDIIAAAGSVVTTQGWSLLPSSPSSNFATTTFWVSVGSTLADPCAEVSVGKAGTPTATTIISQGFNTCAASGGVAKVERVLQLNY